jgi:hypothetical protein
MAADLVSALSFFTLGARALNALVMQDAAMTCIGLCLLAGVWLVGTGRQTS